MHDATHRNHNATHRNAAFANDKFSLAVLFSLGFSAVPGTVEIRIIKRGQESILSVKELDWIHGDYLMTKDHLAMLIAAPLSTRDANMTIRNIGASMLDLTLKRPSNDLQNAYTPTAGRYLFQDLAKVVTGSERDIGLLAVQFIEVIGQGWYGCNGAL